MTEGALFAVAGAGSVGGWIGAKLAAKGARVRFLARPRLLEEWAQHGLTVSDADGGSETVAPAAIQGGDDPALTFQDADVVLVTVKSRDTLSMAALIGEHAPASAVVVSLQNGLRNARRLREALPEFDVRAGVVEFNVAQTGPGRLHRATGGSVAVEAGDPDVGALLEGLGVNVNVYDDMTPLQWGKTLVNLNNALNALSGLPLRAEILDTGWRRLWGDSIKEAADLLALEGVTPVSPSTPSLSRVRLLSRLPAPLFKLIFNAVAKVDEHATSSMQADLVARRSTEIGDLQGEVMALAERLGRTAPLARTTHALIQEAERAGAGPPGLSAADVRSRAQKI